MKYKFIDIGCGCNSVSSDDHFFGTKVKGLLVEPIEEYCKILPQSDTVLVECAAVGEYDGFKDLNTVIEGDIIEYIPYKLYSNQSKMSRYMKNHGIQHCGTSSLCDPDLIVHKNTTEPRLVKLITLNTLIKKYKITEVDQIKIDVEGYEAIVLSQLIELMDSEKLKVNERIIFEYVKEFGNNEELDRLKDEICSKFGFSASHIISNWDSDIVMVKQ